ncbi:MAG: efflux RND transporter periplasmic adaptor subunit [Bacteroidota bacterium]
MAKRNNNRLLLVGLLVAVAGLLTVAYFKGKNRETGVKVQAENVTKRTIKEEVAASGKVFPQTEVKISSDVSGEIVELKVEEGDSVVQGQLLAKIDPDAYQSQVERGVAGVNSAKAQLANARAQVENIKAQKAQIEVQLANAGDIYNRNKKLFEEGVISDADFETATSNYEGLKANLASSEASIRAAQQSAKSAEYQVKSSEATLKELRTSLGRTTIYAPVSGIISLLNVEQGERVVGTIQMTGTEMMRIANLNAMEVQVEVSENDIPRVSIDDDVDVEIDAYQDRTFKGKVFQIANTANNASTAAGVSLTTDQVTNFVVTINIDPSSYADLITPQKPYPFRPGMSASVEINTETLEDIVAIPIQAVTTREDEDQDDQDDNIKEVVFIIPEGADTVQQVEVRTGIQDNNYIRIVQGLSVGQQIVTGPYSAVSRRLKAGEKVRVVEEEELFAEREE